MTTTADILDEYGAAIRGDWGTIDGRAEQAGLSVLAEAIRQSGDRPLTAQHADDLRECLSLCPDGSGHWTEHCGTGCAL